MEYRIDETKAINVLARQGLFVSLASMGLFLGVFMLILVFTGGLEILKIVPKIAPFFLLIGCILFLFSLGGGGILKSKRWVIEDDFVIEYMEDKNLGSFNDFALKRAERKYGQQREKMIRAHQLDHIKFKRNKVVIRQKNYNFWNGNGGIEIPKEAIRYDEIVQKLKAFQSLSRSSRR